MLERIYGHWNYPTPKKHTRSGDLGYGTKDGYILQAIRLISSRKESGYNFYVEAAPDQNGYDSYVIYFDFKIEGKRHQVSFHTFSDKKFAAYVGKGRKTHWDHNLGGSRESCHLLIEKYNL